MNGKRGPMLSGVVGAAVGVVLASRHGESRRAALGRLRLAVRPGRDSVGAFAGTPCAAAGRTHVRTRGDASNAAGPAAPGGREGDDHG
jgi:hypothetical protein